MKRVLLLLALGVGVAGCEQVRELMGNAEGAGGDRGAADLDESPQQTPRAEGPGTLRVTVTRASDTAAPKEHNRSADAYCQQNQPQQAQPSPAVVRIVDALPAEDEAETPREPLVINTTQCDFSPRVAVVREGSPFEIANNDMTMHNIRAFKGTEKASWFNIAQPPKVTPIKKVAQEGPIQLACDIHPWEAAYIFTSAHPWHALANQDGVVTWEGVPAREEPYTVEVWQEGSGAQQVQVAVRAGEVTEVNVSFEQRAAATP